MRRGFAALQEDGEEQTTAKARSVQLGAMSKVSYEHERAKPKAASLREWKKEKQRQRQKQVPCGDGRKKGKGTSYSGISSWW
jgi:hypothetical protein